MKKFGHILMVIFVMISTNSMALSPDFSSPEAVVETFYEAVKERNIEILAQCIHPESNQREALNYHSHNTSQAQLEMYENRLGEWGSIYSVDYDNPHQDKGWIRVKVEFYKNTGESHIITVYVQEHDMGYRIINI